MLYSPPSSKSTSIRTKALESGDKLLGVVKVLVLEILFLKDMFMQLENKPVVLPQKMTSDLAVLRKCLNVKEFNQEIVGMQQDGTVINLSVPSQKMLGLICTDLDFNNVSKERGPKGMMLNWVHWQSS